MKFGQKFAKEEDMSPATKRILGISESELPEAMRKLQERFELHLKMKLEIDPSAHGSILIQNPNTGIWCVLNEFRGLGAAIDTFTGLSELDNTTLNRKVAECLASNRLAINNILKDRQNET